MPRRLPLALGVAALLAAVPLLVHRYLTDPTLHPPDDYVQYWAAARLFLTGGNPYDAGQLLPLEREAGRDTPFAILMLNPPWALPLVAPLGLVPARVGQLVWLVTHLSVCLFCAGRLWRHYGGDPEHVWAAWLVGLSFAPTVMALWGGQIAPFVLLGVVGFLELARAGRWAAAGAALALCGIKPHLIHLVWPALALRALAPSGGPERRVILGGVAAGLVAAGLALAGDPAVMAQYVESLTNPHSPEVHPPLSWTHTPTAGYWLRQWTDPERFAVQSVPTLLAWLCFPAYLFARRRDWDWSDQTPVLILASLLTAAYTYAYDWVLLLVPVLRAAVWVERRHSPRLAGWAAVAFAALGLLALRLPLAVEAATGRPGVQYLVWVVPAVWAAYAALRPRDTLTTGA